VFETEHLALRSITADDAEGLHEAYGDADAMRHWDHPPSRDVSQTAERIRTSAETNPRWDGMWAIRTHAGRFVGAINYHAHNEEQRRLALGWIVVPSCWRQGLMTEAARSVISHCFRHLNAHRIEARLEPENLPSRRLAAKLGFTEEGTLRDWTFTTICTDSTTPSARALVLGHRHHAHAVLGASVRDAVHGRAALAEGPRPRAGHGPCYL